VSSSLSRTMRRLAKKAEKRKERKLMRVLRQDGEDAYLDRVLAEHADRWAKQQWGPHARGRMAVCSRCKAEFMVVMLAEAPASELCRACSEEAAKKLR